MSTVQPEIMLELERCPRPLYATATEIGELFGSPMSRHVLLLADSGRVRSKKLGRAKQAGRIFRVADVLDWLEQDAETMDEVQADLGLTNKR